MLDRARLDIEQFKETMVLCGTFVWHSGPIFQ